MEYTGKKNLIITINGTVREIKDKKEVPKIMAEIREGK